MGIRDYRVQTSERSKGGYHDYCTEVGSEASSQRSERNKRVFVIIVCKHQIEAKGVSVVTVLKLGAKQAAKDQTEAKETNCDYRIEVGTQARQPKRTVYHYPQLEAKQKKGL
jgi:hypothetical protein